MLNGILFLSEDNEKVPFWAYRWLHEPLRDDGVLYYNKKDLKVYKAVVDAVSRYTGLKVRTYRTSDVESAVVKLHFRNQVAVCDIEDGFHLILLNGREKAWLLAFDPLWTNVSRRTVAEAYETLPSGDGRTPITVNVRIHRDHLTRSRKGYFRLGTTKWRFLTVLERSR